MSNYATVQDVILLERPLTADEQTRAEALIPLICDVLRNEANKVGKDLDDMITSNPALASVAKVVTSDICIRALRVSTSGEPMSQESQSALGYTWSGTYSVAGGGVSGCVMNNDLKRLGLRMQRRRATEIFGDET